MKVWVVEEGYYEERGISGIFSSQEKAEEYIRVARNYSYDPDWVDREPEEYELDDRIINSKDYFEYDHFYEVGMDKEGYIEERPKRTGIDLSNIDKVKEHFYFEKKRIYGNRDEVILMAFVNADDEKHAFKKINQKRKQVLDKWPKPEDFKQNKHINV